MKFIFINYNCYNYFLLNNDISFTKINKMNIGILTYDKPHKRTQDIVASLSLLKFKNITIIRNKYREYKNKKINTLHHHRPYQFVGLTAEEISKKYNYELKEIEDLNCYENLEYVLICGSNLLEKKYIKKKFIINSHSGLIPETRGLDSIKWAIYNNKPAGNTLHFIDEKIDQGEIISQIETPVYASDDLQTFFERHYQMELEMLINFRSNLLNKNNFLLTSTKPTMRMSFEKEKDLINKFEIYKKTFAKK